MNLAAQLPVVCVDIGGTSTKVGIFLQGRPITVLESFPTRGPASAFVAEVSKLIARALEHLPDGLTGLAECCDTQPLGIGVGVAGFLSDKQDRLLYNPNLPWLENYPLCDHLGRDFSVPVFLDSDSNTAALAEFHLGSGRGSRRFLCVTIGTGLGVGMVIDGRPLKFAYGCMGDAGHIIVQPNGPLCACGGHGCAELFVAAPALAKEFSRLSGRGEACTLRTVIESALAGDAVAASVLDDAGEWLGIACASLANTFFPDRIAFAGGLAEAGDLVLNGVRRAFEYSASTFAREQVTLHRAALGANATLAGAAYPVLNAVGEQHAVVGTH